MGVYEKIGFRKLGLRAIELINWIRLYGIKDGFSISRSLLQKKKSSYIVRASFLDAPIYLRDNYSDPAIFLQVFYEKQYELFDAPTIQATTIIDAGANIGLASIFFATKYPYAEIAAIEPEHENFNLLKRNTKGYKVDCIHAAIWPKNEPLAITNPETLSASFIIDQSEERSKTEGIEGITIKDIMERKKWEKIDIFKMDIEGAEKEIFSQGDLEWLNHTKLLIIELHDRYKSGTTKALFKAVEPFDYKAYFHHENIFIFLNND